MLFVLACTQCNCTHDRRSPPPAESDSGNSVAAFLNHAERQAETDEQRREIQRALRDMLEKSPAELRQMRYPDYTGEASKWSISQMLQHYFVPNPPAALDEQRLFQEVRAPAARAAIQRQLDEVGRALQ